MFAESKFVTVQISEYADYFSFSDLSLKTAIDDATASAAADLAFKMSESLNSIISLTASSVGATNLTSADEDGVLSYVPLPLPNPSPVL